MTNLIDFSKYKRFFAFGCSFTNYKWPTWADIIGQEFGEENSFNYGRCGAGNYLIAQSVMDAYILNNINSDDLVMIMFTNFQREDRYIKSKGGWIHPGNIYSQDIYSKEWMEYFDEDHALTRDLMLVEFLKNYLENKNIDHHFMCMVPFGGTQDGLTLLTNEQERIISLYQTTVDYIKPSIFELCFNCDWHSVQPRSLTYTGGTHIHHVKGVGWYEDNHAHPKEHLEYIMKLWPETKFKQSTVDYTNYWHQQVLDKTDRYTKNLIQRKQVKKILP